MKVAGVDEVDGLDGIRCQTAMNLTPALLVTIAIHTIHVPAIHMHDTMALGERLIIIYASKVEQDYGKLHVACSF